MTTFSRRPPPWANQRPTISSVAPRPLERPYTLAESKKLIPASSAESMMANEVGSSVSGPKFMVPRQRRLTVRPVRPRCVKRMAPNLMVRCRRVHQFGGLARVALRASTARYRRTTPRGGDRPGAPAHRLTGRDALALREAHLDAEAA